MKSTICRGRTFRRQVIIGAHGAAVALILSGLFHLSLFAYDNFDWEGPVSPRKPGLFGISAGLTAVSLLWCGRVFQPHRRVTWVACAVTWALFVEVALITVQYWRATPSHFNRTTSFNAGIEYLMLILILAATSGIAILCWLSTKPNEIDHTTRLAHRAGLWFLLLSCTLGAVAMICGEYNIAHGRPAETWGDAGVLKYPHGAVLHAIQTIPLVDWLMKSLLLRGRDLVVRILIATHVCFLFHSAWQTFHGYARFSVDIFSGIAVFTAFILICFVATYIGMQVMRKFTA